MTSPQLVLNGISEARSKQHLIKLFISHTSSSKLTPSVYLVDEPPGGEQTPLPLEEILKIPNEELAIKLKEFKSENKWEGKTVERLASELNKSVKQNPNKFIENLNPFGDVGYIYVYKIITGVMEAWNEKKDIDWGKLFKFIQDYISSDDFWIDKYIDHESFEWLMLSAPCVHEDFDSPFFIGSLNELKDKGERGETAKYIGEIYLKILGNFTPDYDQKHIRSLVEFLYIAGNIDNAKNICNIYGSKGLEFLRDLYEKYSKSHDG